MNSLLDGGFWIPAPVRDKFRGNDKGRKTGFLPPRLRRGKLRRNDIKEGPISNKEYPTMK